SRSACRTICTPSACCTSATSTRTWTTWKPATAWAAPATSRHSPSAWPGRSGRSTPTSAPNCNAGTRPTRNAPGAAARRCAGRLSAGRFRNRAPTKPQTPSLWGRPTASNGARNDTTDRVRGPAAREKRDPTDIHHLASRAGTPVGRTALSCPQMAPDRTPLGGQERRCPPYGSNLEPHPCGAGFTPANGARTDTTAGTAAPLAGINPAPQISTTRPHGPVALQGGQRFPVRRWRPTAPRPADKNDVVRPTGLTPDPLPAGPALRRPTALGPTQQPGPRPRWPG